MTKKQSILVAVVAALFVSALVGAYNGPSPKIMTPNVYYEGPPPTLSGCTDGCTIAAYSTSSRGVVTCSGGTGTPCTVTFDTAYDFSYGGNPPACVVSTTASGGTRLNAVPTTSAFSFTLGGDGQYDYFCDGVIQDGADDYCLDHPSTPSCQQLIGP